MKTQYTTLFLILIVFTFARAMAESRCIGHRGLSSQYLQNSMESLRQGLEIGADGIEFDIRHTLDGIPIVLHNNKLKGVAKNKDGFTCPIDQKVSKLTFQEIRQKCLLKNGEEIPLFSDVLQMATQYDAFLFIELKDKPSKQFFEVTDTYITNFEKTRFISFWNRVLRPVKKYYPKAHTILITRTLPIGKKHGGLAASTNFIVNFYRLFGGKETGRWTVNREKDIKKLKSKKIDFIITDYPDLCMKL